MTIDTNKLRTLFTGNLKTLNAMAARSKELSEQIKSLEAEKKALESARQDLRGGILHAMQTAGLFTITVTDTRTGEAMLFKRQLSPGKITLKEGVTPEMLPERYQRIKIEADKIAIKADLKEGHVKPRRAGEAAKRVEIEDYVDVVREDSLHIESAETAYNQGEEQ